MEATFKFEIDEPPERAAGLPGFQETVTITLEHGGFADDRDWRNDFIESMRQQLAELFDVSRVFTEDEYQKIIDDENRQFDPQFGDAKT